MATERILHIGFNTFDSVNNTLTITMSTSLNYHARALCSSITHGGRDRAAGRYGWRKLTVTYPAPYPIESMV